jgi:hypothetical protein
MELIFEVRDAEEGGYCARARGYGIFTEAETWVELRANVLEATSLHFEDGFGSKRVARPDSAYINLGSKRNGSGVPNRICANSA